MGKVYKSAMGKSVDMSALLAKHGDVPAVGNLKVNARGDKLGPNGKIIEPVNVRAKEYYTAPPIVAENISLKGDEPENSIVVTPEPVKEKAVAKKSKAVNPAKVIEKELPDGSIQILSEDDMDGGVSDGE